ncbi:hypothetical protein [Paraburkholderia guartelaensis]|uniref:OmpR/PhoB-type domain-containing protein n=1 Tax=Paraburkholderia guartelaensis TaxID=2546446 RepID=A0ABU9S3X8_9BURK
MLTGVRAVRAADKILTTLVRPGNTVEAQISALRRALGDDRAAIRTVTGRGYQFIAEVLPQVTNSDRPPAAPADGPAFSGLPLPAEVSPLIGQEIAVREIYRGLQTHRLVTLVGTGGVGKTRLALEAAHGAARIAERLLRIAPRAVVLATSRETLRVAGELIYRVPSLEVPPDENCDVALDYSAVRLFEERVGPHAGLSVDSRTALRLKSQICRRLDGIPLALNLLRHVCRRLGSRAWPTGSGIASSSA